MQTHRIFQRIFIVVSLLALVALLGAPAPTVIITNQAAPPSMLQFSSAKPVLGFAQDRVYIANPDHSMRV